MSTAEQRLADALLDLATDGPTDRPFEVPSLLALLTAHATGLLADCAAGAVAPPHHGEGLHVAGSPPAVHQLELDAAGRGEGPGQDCRRSGTPVRPTPLDSPVAKQHWPHYAARARRLGHTHTAALPLRGEADRHGALVLLAPRPEPLCARALSLAESLARMAAVTLGHERAAHAERTRVDQLQHALTSRILIEQAKGVLAARRSVPVDEAFALIRRQARAEQRLLTEVAREVIEGHNALTTG
ncbi:ANTAR domain-containing protein [Streptomyces monticola]|uniref:ANTAR domain-containing protein n=1 Tax=Streptomyces monticola TaxID=2666263 RepID=A0ABW2JTH1_9ACTN